MTVLSNAIPLAIYIAVFLGWVNEVDSGNAEVTVGSILVLLVCIPFYFLIRHWIIAMLAWVVLVWVYTCRDKNPFKMVLKTCMMIAWVFGPLIWFIVQMD